MLSCVSVPTAVGIVQRPPGRLLSLVGLVAFVLLLMVAQPAGAVTIGSDLSVNAGSSLGTCPCTYAPTEGQKIEVPADGVLTRWRFKEFESNDLSGLEFKLVVLQGNKAVAIDPQVLGSKPKFTQTVYEFTANIPVHAGERLALESPGIYAVFGFPTNSASYVDEWAPPLTLNETRDPTLANYNNTHELLLNADIGAPSPPSGGGGGASNGAGGTGKATVLNGGPSPTVLTNKPSQFTAPAKCELPPGSPFTCSGSVVLKSVGGGDSGKPSDRTAGVSAKPKSVVLGQATFNIAPGQTAQIKVKLKPKAQSTLKNTGKLRGTLTTTSALTDGTKASVSQNLTVKLKPKPKPKPKHE